jgi:hypothetical protein
MSEHEFKVGDRVIYTVFKGMTNESKTNGRIMRLVPHGAVVRDLFDGGLDTVLASDLTPADFDERQPPELNSMDNTDSDLPVIIYPDPKKCLSHLIPIIGLYSINRECWIDYKTGDPICACAIGWLPIPKNRRRGE